MIRTERLTETVFEMKTEDGGYKTRVTTGGRIGDDDTAADGVFRPGCHLRVEGLDDETTASQCNEVAAFRALGEDELRELAKMLLMAANELRRIENKRRKARKT